MDDWHGLDVCSAASDQQSTRPSHSISHEHIPSIKHTQEYSEIYREAGAAAIAVNVDPLTGGCSHKDIQDIVREQHDAINNDVAGAFPCDGVGVGEDDGHPT